MFNSAISASETDTPRRYVRSSHSAVTVSRADVSVPRMSDNSRPGVRSGTPAQFRLMWLNRRCSTRFHLLAPRG
jgi:hypothetical protein